MNRHEAAAEAVRAIARDDLPGARQVLHSGFGSVTAAASVEPDPLLIVRANELYEANDYRSEPSLEYLDIVLLCAVDALENRTASLATDARRFIDYALRLAVEEDCDVEKLGNMAVAAREPTDQSYCVTCMAVAKHYLDRKDPVAANAWLDRLDRSNLDGIFLKTVQNLRALATGW